MWNGPLVDTVGQGLGQGLGTGLGQGQGLGVGPGQVGGSGDGVGVGIDEEDDRHYPHRSRCCRLPVPVHLLCLSPQEAAVVAYSAFTGQRHSKGDNNGTGGGGGGGGGSGGGNYSGVSTNSGSIDNNSGNSGSSGNSDIAGALCSYSLNGRWLKSAIVDERINTMIMSQVSREQRSEGA